FSGVASKDFTAASAGPPPLPRTLPRRGSFFGSSRFTGECGPDLQEEVVRVAVAVGHSLDDLDAVVHAFQNTGVEAMTGAGDDAVNVLFEFSCERNDRCQAAVHGHPEPLVPAPFCGVGTGRVPQRLELLFQQV